MPDIREGPRDGKSHLDLPSVMGKLTEDLPRSATRFVYASISTGRVDSPRCSHLQLDVNRSVLDET